VIGLALLRSAPANAASACRLGGGAIKHVIIMQFDNVISRATIPTSRLTSSRSRRSLTS
jgi:hypothetical protein